VRAGQPVTPERRPIEAPTGQREAAR
jgi:hypothetical protein